MARQAKKVSEIEEVRAAIIRDQWGMGGAEKVARYVGKFFDRQRIGKKIVARVVGNHGTYTVSFSVKAGRASGACNCYVDRDGCQDTWQRSNRAKRVIVILMSWARQN